MPSKLQRVATVSKEYRNRFFHSTHLWLTDTWALEIAALGLGILSFVAIVVLLSVYDGHQQFDFGGVTLNAVIAVLAAAVRIGFVVPVSESLAQWKWLWFGRKLRPLEDFDIIDDASRGSRGSAILLWGMKSATVTSIAAWVILLSIATEPFIQQIVSFQDVVNYQDSGLVSIPYGQRWNGGTEISFGGDAEAIGALDPPPRNITLDYYAYGDISKDTLDDSGQAAVQYGLNADPASISQQLSARCPSGNCTWPAFASLSVCSRCTDISNQVKSAPSYNFPQAYFYPDTEFNLYQGDAPENSTTYYLPNGLSMTNRPVGTENQLDSTYHAVPLIPVAATYLAGFTPSTTLTYQNSTTLLFSLSIMRALGTDYPTAGFWQSAHATIEATECALYLCAKSYTSKKKDGNLLEETEELASTRDPTSYQIASTDGWPVTWHGNMGDIDALYAPNNYFIRNDLRINITSPPGRFSNNLTFVNVSQAAIDSLTSFILSQFDDGTFTNKTLIRANTTTATCTIGTQVIECGAIHNVSGMASGSEYATDAHHATLFSPAVMRNVYQSPNLTQLFANLAQSISNEMRMHADNTPTITGRLGTVRTVLQVQWPWITLPAVLLVVSAGFFVMTVVENKKQKLPVWKGSVVPVLIHGLEEKVRRMVDHGELLSDMERETEEIRVRLRRGKNDVLMLRVGEGGEAEEKVGGVQLTVLKDQQSGGGGGGKHKADVATAREDKDGLRKRSPGTW